MKTRINLFEKKRRPTEVSAGSEIIKLYGTIAGTVLFVIFIFFTYLQFNLQVEKQRLLEKKQNVSGSILQNKEIIGKMSYYSEKTNQIKKFLKDDAQFLPYYNLLNDAIVSPTGLSTAPILESMEIDKNKSTDFTVRFSEFQPTYEFLKVMESEIFLSNFVELRLVGFSLNNEIGAETGYNLQFKGKFKPIDGT